MFPVTFSSRTSFRASSLVWAAICVSLTGCGLGGPASVTPEAVTMTAVQGVVHGGASPIVGASVILWQTTSGGYGAPAVRLSTGNVLTASDGSFSIPNGYTCAAGQFVYITATGGNSGANTVNPQSVQMAPLGSCSNFSAGNGFTAAQNQARVNVFVSEASTIVSAYTLGNFISINQNGGTGNQLVSVGAPANNNALAGACTGSGPTMTCTSAGLAHAFANAANLVDAVRYDGSAPSGLTYAAPPTNTAGVAPRALINSLANVLQYCTNSAGGTAGTTPCGKLFGYATPAASTNGVNGTPPADELSAAINIAKAPANNVTSIFNLASSFVSFTPTLTTAPTDWSVAIWYPTVLAGSSTAAYPEGVALDANDDVYTLLADAATPTESAVAGLTANGSLIFNNVPNTTYCNPANIATDSLTNVFYTNFGATGGTCGTATNTYAILGFSTITGAANTAATFTGVAGVTPAIGPQPYGIAVDRLNDIFYSHNGIGLLAYSGGGSTGGTYTLKSTGTAVLTGSRSVAIDADQNVWTANNTAAGTNSVLGVLDNIGDPATTPSYAAGEVLLQSTLPNYGGGSIAIDAAGNGWASTVSNVSEVVPTYMVPSATITKVQVSASFITFTAANTFTIGDVVQIKGLTSACGLSVDPAGTTYTAPVAASSLGPTKFAVAIPANSITACVGNETGSQQATGASQITALGNASAVATVNAAPAVSEFDGANTQWISQATAGGGVFYYVPATSTSQGINPCYLPASATACSAGTGGANYLQVDSAGSIWVSAPGSNSVVEIIGSAAPTWPQLSYGHPAAMPQ